MLRKITSLLAASAVAIVALAPVEASARNRRDNYYNGYNGGYDCRNDGRRGSCNGYNRHRNYGRHYYRDRDYYRDRHNDDGDAVAAGVIGLVLGLAIGAAAEADQRRPDDYYDGRQYDPYANRREGYYQQGYDEPQQQQCWRRERQWDRYANRYVYVDVPC